VESGNDDSSVYESNEEYTSQILSGVRFSPLQIRPAVATVIPSTVWSPLMQQGFPSEFKLASRHLLLCSNSHYVQPLPVSRQEERFNVAAMLPKTIWLEILSYTHRKWFEPKPREIDYLKRRLREEKDKLAKAETACREAEARCHAAERERAVYRLLALRWQSRMNSLLNRQGHQGVNAQQNEVFADISDSLDLRDINNSTLAGLRAIMQQLHDNVNNEDVDNDSDESSSVADNEDGVEDMEEDDAEENQVHSDEDEVESDLDEFASVADEDLHEDDLMEDVGRSIGTGQRAIDQPRSISMSSDDL